MRKLLVAIAAATMLVSACGGNGASGGSPKEQLTNAVENLSSGGHTVTLSLDSDTASLTALSEGELNEDAANKILDSSLSISSNGEQDPAKSQFALSATIAGSNDVEVRFVDQVLYLRVDVNSLVDLAGGDARAQATAAINALVQQASAQGLDWVGDGVQGKWLAFKGLESLLSQLGANASPTAEQQALVKQFTDAVTQGATVTSEGSDDAGDHLVATVGLRDVYKNFVDLAQNIGQGVPTGTLPDESQVPDEDIKVDFWVDGDQLTQIEFDLVQIAQMDEETDIPEGVDKLAVKLALSDFSGSVEVPSGAVDVDLTQLIQAFSGGLGGSTGSSSSGDMSSFCDQLKSQPQSVQQQFSDQCPNL